MVPNQLLVYERIRILMRNADPVTFKTHLNISIGSIPHSEPVIMYAATM